MAKNIRRLAGRLGAKVVSRVPDVGGGAFHRATEHGHRKAGQRPDGVETLKYIQQLGMDLRLQAFVCRRSYNNMSRRRDNERRDPTAHPRQPSLQGRGLLRSGSTIMCWRCLSSSRRER